MIGLNLLQLLQDNDFGTLDQDLLFQKVTLDKIGVWLTYVGDPIDRGSRDRQSYELFSRGSDDVEGVRKLKEIRDFLKNSYSSICELPEVAKYDVEAVKNVTLTRPSTITAIGYDDNGRMIYSIQGSIIY